MIQLFRIAPRSAALLGLCFVGALLGQTLRRPLVVDESRYRAVAGERILIEASSDTAAFMRSAKTRIARAPNRTFPLAPNVSGDRILLGIPLTTEPGDYAISISFLNGAGEERFAAWRLTHSTRPSPNFSTWIEAVGRWRVSAALRRFVCHTEILFP